eukprot:TRINITY_DN9588_c0_g1_i1.p1 TRINITY_DN9588_c0_g1~~TRINITY_DN9588_c0_g1_i1.p1  ORF type:complete len:308 (+),score=12.32 TRINITY_DN9588_c0_g1_i1:87-1010(+)
MRSYVVILVGIFAVVQVISIFRVRENIKELSSQKSSTNLSLIKYLINILDKVDKIEHLTLTDDKCPEGFQKEQLGSWPGIKESCTCRSGVKFIERACKPAELGKGCRNLPAIPPITYSKWKNKSICTRRYEYKLDPYIRECDRSVPSSCCGGGWKPCANGLCVKSESQCPIVAIAKVEGSRRREHKSHRPIIPATNNASAQDPDILVFEDKTKFKILREGEPRPILGLEVSRTASPCFDPSVFSTGQNSLYPLLEDSQYDEVCAPLGYDTRSSTTVDMIPETVLLSQNNIYPGPGRDIPDYLSLIHI